MGRLWIGAHVRDERCELAALPISTLLGEGGEGAEERLRQD